MEVALGQSLSLGGIGVYGRICPIFKGVGYAAAIMAFWLNIYYIVVLAWAIYYLWHSFARVLPWSTCGNWWNTPACVPSSAIVAVNASNVSRISSSAYEFWE